MSDAHLLTSAVKDFIFDLHDSVRRSQRPDELRSLYTQTFPELSSKYYASEPWPTSEAVSSECEGDSLFLSLYNELTMRHLFTNLRPTLTDKLSCWTVYKALFDAVLASDDNDRDTAAILPEWGFEIMHEFVYQYQGFCQFRTRSSALSAEDIEILDQNKDAWAVGTVMYYLHALVKKGKAAASTASANPNRLSVILGYFATLSLSRLECLLGDFHASLAALDGIDLFGKDELFYPLFPARLSLFYHAGVSYFVLRRYKDATRVMSKMVADIDRGFKANQLKKLPGFEQFMKLNDKMVALLAIISHIQPSIKMDESLQRTIADKHGDKLAKIEAGEDDYEDLFTTGCPKFVSPVVPTYDGSSSVTNLTAAAYTYQIQQTVSELGNLTGIPKLRSYLKLYTSIDIEKLANFNDCSGSELTARLLAFKQKAIQLERSGEMRSTSDVHFYVQNDMIVVDNKKYEYYFDGKFNKEIYNLKDIEVEVGNIPSVI
jgi:translation initiation factor 3 subunit L